MDTEELIANKGPPSPIKRWKKNMIESGRTSLKTSQMVFEIPNSIYKTSLEMVCGKREAKLGYFIFGVCQWLPTKLRMNYFLDTQAQAL